VHFYVSQSDKGELVMGGDLDFCNSYTQRGNLPIIEHVVSACLALFPSFGRLKVMRTWGGVCDMTMDGSPIIGILPVQGLTMTGGWCYGGFASPVRPADSMRTRWRTAAASAECGIRARSPPRRTIDEKTRG
jgi:glycine/D-amino acid oxidase-like deaminating enzyme